MGVLDVGYTDGGVTNPVVHHRVYTHGHAILGQDLILSHDVDMQQ